MMPAAEARPGVFVTLEGGEGAGKSTLAHALAKRARAGDVDVVVTREPGGTAGAEALRHVVLSGVAKRFGPFAEAMLFAAARSDHVYEVIRPALARGALVICDRFSDSTSAYQGIVSGVDERLIKALDRVAIGPTRPDLTLILDIDPAQAATRRRGRGGPGDRFEDESAGFHGKLREAFLRIAAREPARCRVLDAAQSEHGLGEAAWALIEDLRTRKQQAVAA